MRTDARFVSYPLCFGTILLFFLCSGLTESPCETVVSRWEEAAQSIPSATETWIEIQNLYQKAKETGETATQNTYEWAREDLSRIGTWEYRVVSASLIDPVSLEEKLSQLGSERWECFHIQSLSRNLNTSRILLFLKRPVRSYLKNLPLPSLWKFLPKGESGGEPSSEGND